MASSGVGVAESLSVGFVLVPAPVPAGSTLLPVFMTSVATVFSTSFFSASWSAFFSVSAVFVGVVTVSSSTGSGAPCRAEVVGVVETC